MGHSRKQDPRNNHLMTQNIPDTDIEFRQWGSNFVLQCQAHAAELGLSPADLAALGEVSSGCVQASTNLERARAAYHGAVATKRIAFEGAEATYRRFAKQFMANPALPVSVLSALGFGVTPPQTSSVTTPRDLAATGFSNGQNRLVWNRSGNSKATVFLIEALFGGSSEWIQVGATTKSKFDHAGHIPGVQVIYRVRAQRANAISSPSNTAILYAKETAHPEVLQKAA
ncbi:MAG: hypothetical protein ABL949_14330 [Fimbriimonadaceae bacterium]